MKKTIAKDEAFEEALSRYAEQYHVSMTPPLPESDDELTLLFGNLVNSIEAYCGRKRGRRSLRFTIKL